MSGKMPMNEPTVIMNSGGEGNFLPYANAKDLKQVDVPVEGVVGAANGAITGAVIAGGISAAVTLGNGVQKEVALQQITRNIVDKHLLPFAGGVAAFTALGALIRTSKAVNHNKWAERYFGLIKDQQAASHADRMHEIKQKDAAKDSGATVG